MTHRRPHLLPWHRAGNVADNNLTADEVVRETGWVFNNETGSRLTLEDFVKSGDKEVGRFLRILELQELPLSSLELLEIGCGIGRMTATLTKLCSHVYAADVDPAFLERCRHTVSKFGQVDRLSTISVQDGRHILMDQNKVDVTFSYITLQHCKPEDALALVREAIRVTRPGGTIVLNFRKWVPVDVLLIPCSKFVRMLWRTKRLGKQVSNWRWATRLGWQANRLRPEDVLGEVATYLENVTVFHSTKRHLNIPSEDVLIKPAPRINPSHWWLVAQVS